MSTLEAVVTAVDPRSGEELDRYPETPPGAVAALVQAAVAAAADPALADRARRAAALRGAAAALRAAGDELAASAARPRPGSRPGGWRGELERTCRPARGSSRDVVTAGDYVEAIIDPADPEARPDPAPRRAAHARAARAGRGLRREQLPARLRRRRRRHGGGAGRRLPGDRQGPPVAARASTRSSRACVGDAVARRGPARRDLRRRPGRRPGARRGARRRRRRRGRGLHRLHARRPGALRPRRAARPPDPGLRGDGQRQPGRRHRGRAAAARGRDRSTASSRP